MQYKEIRGEVINLKGGNTKVTKRVDELENKWRNKFETGASGDATAFVFKLEKMQLVFIVAFFGLVIFNFGRI